MGHDVVALDLGGTHMRSAVITPEGEVKQRHRVDTPIADPHPDRLVRMLRDAAEESGAGEAVLGFPGRVNYAEGTLEYAPHLPQGWLADLSRTKLAAVTGLEVHVVNDAEMAAAGEAIFGAGRGIADIVYITISTGIGAGVVQHGRLVHGRRSMPEPGHTIVDAKAFEDGRPAFMEDFASGTALGARARESGLGAAASDVLDGLERGDPRAREAWAGALRAIQVAVYNLGLWFSPEAVVIGGGVGLNAPRLLEDLRDWLDANPVPGLPGMRIERAALGDDAGLVGAAAYSRMFGAGSARS